MPCRKNARKNREPPREPRESYVCIECDAKYVYHKSFLRHLDTHRPEDESADADGRTDATGGIADATGGIADATGGIADATGGSADATGGSADTTGGSADSSVDSSNAVCAVPPMSLLLQQQQRRQSMYMTKGALCTVLCCLCYCSSKSSPQKYPHPRPGHYRCIVCPVSSGGAAK